MKYAMPHSVHKVCVCFFKPIFAHPAHLRRVLPSTGRWDPTCYMTRALFRCLSPLHLCLTPLLEHGDSYLLSVSQERFYHHDVVAGIWSEHLLQKISTLGKELFFHHFRDFPPRSNRLAIWSTRSTPLTQDQ